MVKFLPKILFPAFPTASEMVPTGQSQEVKLEFKLSGNTSDLWAHFALEMYFPRYARFGIIATGLDAACVG